MTYDSTRSITLLYGGSVPLGDNSETWEADFGDVDSDAVRDTCDTCPNTIPGSTVDSNGCPPLIPGDFDRDGDVDLADFAHFRACALGPALPQTNPTCADAKFDADDDVDLDDFGVFQRCYSGANNPANPNCAN